jgi:hypothetical protein
MALRIDGKDYDAATPEAQAAITTLESDREKIKGNLAAEQAKSADLSKRLDSANDPKRLTEAVAKRVQLLADVAKGNRHFMSDADDAPDGEAMSTQSAVDIMKDAIKRWNPGIKIEGQSDDFVTGVFSAMIADLLGEDTEPTPTMTDALPPPKASPPEMELNGRPGATPLARSRAGLRQPGTIKRDSNGYPIGSGSRTDASDEDPEARQYKENSERWQKPLSASKGT